MTIAGVSNRTVAVTCAGAGCVGTGGLTGSASMIVLQLLNLTIPLTPVGREGAIFHIASGSILLSVLGQGWTTGTAAVGAVTTTTPGTALVHTVTLMGSDARTAQGRGSITLVSGFQVITNVVGTNAGFAAQTLRFAAAPEPGTLLLLGAGATALVLLGRRRLRR